MGTEPTTAYIGLGSNLGERENMLKTALKMLGETDGVRLARVSKIIESAPLGPAGQDSYLNAVAEVVTTKSGAELHKRLHSVETSLGRVRQENWGPRVIDLDLLLFGDEVIEMPHLRVPHAQMHLRSFVLRGLCELNSGLVHPLLKVTVGELAARLGGGDFMLNPEAVQLVSISGVIGVGKTTLTKKLSALLGCRRVLEAYDENPFLADVYGGRDELALDSQLFFLASRLEQLSPEKLPRGEAVLADYIFDKELIYAGCLLNPQQLALYKKLYEPLKDGVAGPVLVIYLQDSVANCRGRIRSRNRAYEQRIEGDFLERLVEDYDRLFESRGQCPVMRLSMSEFDCTRDADVQDLAEQIRYYLAV